MGYGLGTPRSPASPATAAKLSDHQVLLDVTLESLAPMHATGDVELLTDVRAPAPGEHQYETFGVVHPVAAVGTLATPHFDVPDVRHVPGLGQRAVVVSLFELMQSGLVFGFGPGTFDVTVATTGDRIGEGRSGGGRYYLDYLRVPPSKSN